VYACHVVLGTFFIITKGTLITCMDVIAHTRVQVMDMNAGTQMHIGRHVKWQLNSWPSQNW